MKSTITWQGNMKFNADFESGHNVMMDAGESSGGENSAPRPKPLLLAGLGGCTGMDVVSILNKMKALPEKFRMEIEADMTEDHPVIFKSIHLKYIYSGDIPVEKIKRAVDLSQDKYCGVSAMMKAFASVTYEILRED